MQALDIRTKPATHRLNPSFWTKIKLWKLGWIVSQLHMLAAWPWGRNPRCPFNMRIVGNCNPYAASETRKISYIAHGLVTKPTYTHKLQGVSQCCLVFFAGHLVICQCKTQSCMFPSQDDSYGSKHVKVLSGVNKTHYLCYATMTF